MFFSGVPGIERNTYDEYRMVYQGISVTVVQIHPPPCIKSCNTVQFSTISQCHKIVVSHLVRFMVTIVGYENKLQITRISRQHRDNLWSLWRSWILQYESCKEEKGCKTNLYKGLFYGIFEEAMGDLSN